MTDDEVTRFLRAAPEVPMPPAVLARLRAAVAAEAELRRAADVAPDAEGADLKQPSPLWVDDPVEDA